MTMRFANLKSDNSWRVKVFASFTILLLPFVIAPAQKSEGIRQPSTISASAVGYEGGGLTVSKTLGCLPKDVRADEAVAYGIKGKSVLTVEKRLAEMKARCRRGKLVDGRRREIRFFRPSCWGNPPADYQEIQQRENEELAKLKRRYTVIVFGCNPMIQ